MANRNNESIRVEWSLGADQKCDDCNGTGQVLVPDASEIKTYALCDCWRPWRIALNKQRRLRAEAQERFEESR